MTCSALHWPARATLLTLLLAVPWLLCGCGGGGEPASTDPGDESSGALEAGEGTPAEAPTPVPEPAAPARWPRAEPETAYRVVEVVSPRSVTGTVAAAAEGPGRAYSEACRSAAPTFAAGPLPDAVVWIQGIDSGAPLPARDAAVALGSCDASPRIQLASLGGELRLTSADGVARQARLIREDGYRDLGLLDVPATGEVTRRLRVPGLLHLRGEGEGDGRAWIYVARDPYSTLTGAGGSFTLEGVPGGEGDGGARTLHVWHEAFAKQEQGLPPAADPAVPLQLTLDPRSD